MSRSRNPSPSSGSLEDFQSVDDFTAELSLDPDHELIVSEIGVLQSIYGDNAIRPWRSSPEDDARSQRKTRYEVNLRLPSPHEDVPLRILISLPSSYPATSPPQLQLLSRYIGAFGVDSELFGSILRTFISTSGVEWTPDTVCVFDGLESVVERCTTWYEDHLNAQEVGELLRADAKEHSTGKDQQKQATLNEPTSQRDLGFYHAIATLPEGVEITEAEAIVDRRSVFVGRACQITDPSQVPLILAYLMSDRRIAKAAHPIINAWRCQVGSVLHQDNDDDRESAAGGRLAHLLQILDVNNVLIVVTRYYGGILLGPDRFKHINQAARDALELGGFLNGPDPKRSKGSKRERNRS